MNFLLGLSFLVTNEVSRSISFLFLSSKLASTAWSSKSKEIVLSVSVESASNWLQICSPTNSSFLVLPAPVWICMFFIILSAQWDWPSTFGSSPWTLLKKIFFFYLKNDHHSCYMSFVFFCYLPLSLPITVLVQLVREKPTYRWSQKRRSYNSQNHLFNARKEAKYLKTFQNIHNYNKYLRKTSKEYEMYTNSIRRTSTKIEHGRSQKW